MDAETGVSSVVYRRRQWNYGVITLDDNHSDEETVETRKYRGSQGAAV